MMFQKLSLLTEILDLLQNFGGVFKRQWVQKFAFSTAFYPQTNGKLEKTIQTLEDIFRACVIDFYRFWSKYLPLIEFAYNNSYQVSIEMPLYKALYGRKCRSLIHWNETRERKFLGPELIRETIEALEKIQKRIYTAQSRQKHYSDPQRRKLEFNIRDKVFLKIAPIKRIMRFGKKGKLNPRYVGLLRYLT
ncbi:Ribonuclease H-like domain containing protein, partial [Parasponia andersonii]